MESVKRGVYLLRLFITIAKLIVKSVLKIFRKFYGCSLFDKHFNDFFSNKLVISCTYIPIKYIVTLWLVYKMCCEL